MWRGWNNEGGEVGMERRLQEERMTNVAWKIIHINIQRKYCITGVLMPGGEGTCP